MSLMMQVALDGVVTDVPAHYSDEDGKDKSLECGRRLIPDLSNEWLEVTALESLMPRFVRTWTLSDVMTPCPSDEPDADAPMAEGSRTELLLLQILEQMQQQTAAINSLALSNQALIDALIEQDDGDADDDEPSRYMDGTLVHG